LHVVRQHAIRPPQEIQVLVEAREHVVPPHLRAARQREGRRERLGAILEALEAQHFASQRHGLGGTALPSEKTHLCPIDPADEPQREAVAWSAIYFS
jgi:hypothetical protein